MPSTISSHKHIYIHTYPPCKHIYQTLISFQKKEEKQKGRKMEHHHSSTHYLMWKLQDMNSFRRPPPPPPPPPPFFQESLVWPPRSYSCSFCRREFRSAQALGGHMNVHRRDRAKLKQSPPPQETDDKILTTPPPLPLMRESSERRYWSSHEESFVDCNKRHKVGSVCSSSSMEEIDLELRLGAPAIKVAHI